MLIILTLFFGTLAQFFQVTKVLFPQLASRLLRANSGNDVIVLTSMHPCPPFHAISWDCRFEKLLPFSLHPAPAKSETAFTPAEYERVQTKIASRIRRIQRDRIWMTAGVGDPYKGNLARHSFCPPDKPHPRASKKSRRPNLSNAMDSLRDLEAESDKA
jgi:hypothetical protein